MCYCSVMNMTDKWMNPVDFSGEKVGNERYIVGEVCYNIGIYFDP